MSPFDNPGRTLVLVGLAIAGAGALVLVLQKLGINLFRLPGDIVIQRENFRFSFPVVSCIVLSIVLSVLLSIFRK